MTSHIEQDSHSSQLRRIEKLRRRTEPVANIVFRVSLAVGVASALFCILTSGNTRLWGIRAFGICFAGSVSVFIANSALQTIEAWLKRDFVTTAGMFLWTALQGFIMYLGLIITIVGLQHRR